MVVIGLRQAGERHKPEAVSLGKELVQLLIDINHVDVGVLVTEAAPAEPHARDHAENTRWPFFETYTECPVFGTSIGIRDRPGTGTLGLSMLLQWDDGTEEMAALTCRHVVVQYCPCLPDHNDALAVFQNIEGHFERTNADPLPEEHDREIPQERNMDWALIRLSPRRSPGPAAITSLPLWELSPPPSELISKMKLDIYMTPSPEPLRYSEGEDEQLKVFKFGRTTGATAGAVNGIDVTAVTEYTIVRDGQEHTETIVSTERARIPSKGRFGGPERFSAKGDSGSPVFVSSGHPAGMMIGGHKKMDRVLSLVGHFHYMSSLQEIVADIARVMGRDDPRGVPKVIFI
ncbi:hypothetical protein Micbo1qcDRAFT_222351 [Microdochium bolleyi]|uniref:Peptidase S1 domain-containing protein n=1 Tax=Microdochium bolleyi TaxID=196109 RepID=A0A136J5W4_9PEZI|nr:hypothetical protein Micbo1qcDRAFT_222351 [Microdochium bolleyi]